MNEIIFLQDPPQKGDIHMEKDALQLETLTQKTNSSITVRFFEWIEPSVSFGYLLDERMVQSWSKNKGNIPLVKRPTGGGAVFHTPEDLSVSILWPRHKKIFPENPRDCYKAVHQLFLDTLRTTNPGMVFGFFSPPEKSSENTCAVLGTANETKNFSVCFQKPVCFDILNGEQKILGGALRLKKNAALYQGTIQNLPNFDKKNFIETFKKNLML